MRNLFGFIILFFIVFKVQAQEPKAALQMEPGYFTTFEIQIEGKNFGPFSKDAVQAFQSDSMAYEYAQKARSYHLWSKLFTWTAVGSIIVYFSTTDRPTYGPWLGLFETCILTSYFTRKFSEAYLYKAINQYNMNSQASNFFPEIGIILSGSKEALLGLNFSF